MKRGRSAERIPNRLRKRFNIYPNKMLNDLKAEKASERIKLKKEQKEKAELKKKVLRERYGIC